MPFAERWPMAVEWLNFVVDVGQLIAPVLPNEKQHLTLTGLVSQRPLMYNELGHKAVSIHLNKNVNN